MRHLSLVLLVASCTPLVGARSQNCAKDFAFKPHVAVLSSVDPNHAGGSGVGLADCRTLEPVNVVTSEGDVRGIYNKFVAKKVRNLDETDARSLGMKRFLLVEVETDCGGACQPGRFSYPYECGPGPVVTSLRVLEGTKAYPLHLDDVVTEAERGHERFLASCDQELRALAASGTTRPVREETLTCVELADAPNLHVMVRTVASVPADCAGHTDCFMVPRSPPVASLASDYTVSRDGRIVAVRTHGPEQN